MKTIKECLGKRRLYCDGATGSFLQTRGLKGGELPERWNLTRPDDIVELARVYFEAGSDIVNTNTFGANRLRYPDPDELHAIVAAGVKHVREGMRQAGREDGFVALDIGPTGKLLKPLGDLEFEDAVELFAEIVRSGSGAGADLILIETMADTLEVKAAVLAAKENSDLPVCVTMAFSKSGRLLTGGTVESVIAMLEGLGVDALGMNCGLDPNMMLPIVKQFTQKAHVPVICNPNAGPPKMENGQAVYDLTPEEFADAMREIAASGVSVLGGCCGTTPEYIRKIIAETREIPVNWQMPEKKTVVSSSSRTVNPGDARLTVGTRIHPDDEECRKAMLDGDVETLIDNAYEQEDADILCVNVGIPGIDEADLLEQTVREIQAVLPQPLLIESADRDALEGAMRCYNGKPLICFAEGCPERQEEILPLVRKYGSVMIVSKDASKNAEDVRYAGISPTDILLK